MHMNQWGGLSSFLAFPLATKAVIATTLVVIAIFIISTLILRYHWREYGASGDEAFTIAGRRYMAGGVFLLFVIIASAIAYFI